MSRITGIRAISFDADGTLWDFEKVRRHSLRHVLKELEKTNPDAAGVLSIEIMQQTRDRVAEELKGRVMNLEKVRLESFRRTLMEIGRPDEALASHLNQVYLKHRFEEIELFRDVIPVLEELQTRYTLGILSNGNSYPERCGLDGLFRFVVFSQDYGVEKPDPRLFEVAMGEAGCTRHQLLHVGDSLHNDVAGAMNAGIRCVWVNRKGTENDLGFKIDHEISFLTELPEIVG